MAIIVSPPGDVILSEAGLRLRSELGSAGIDSHFADCSVPDAAEVKACATARAMAPASAAPWPAGVPPVAAASVAPPPAFAVAAASATISLAREDRAVTIEVVTRVTEGWKLFRLVYVSPAAGRDDSSVLAIRAVELLRDLRLDRERWEPRGVSRVDPAAAVAFEPPPSTAWSSPFSRWGITSGISVLQGRSGLGASVAPALGLSADLGTRWSLLAQVAGPFSYEVRGRSTSASASDVVRAATRQDLALVGLRYGLEWTRVRPFVTLAAGVYHLRAAFPALNGNPASAEAMWVPAGTAGAGAAFPVTSWLSLVAEAATLVSAPGGEVTIGGEVVASAGAPSLLFQAAAWFFL